MTFIIDHEKMREMAKIPLILATDSDLCREGHSFFVGGALPISATLETIFESYGAESADLFVLTFGGTETIRNGLEMAKVIKKNFNTRLLVRISTSFVPDWLYEQIYASGADLLDIMLPYKNPNDFQSTLSDKITPQYLAAKNAFPRWSVASTVTADGSSCSTLIRRVEDLLQMGIVPLPRIMWDGQQSSEQEIHNLLQHLSKSWRTHHVPIKQFSTLITLFSPLVLKQKPGALRNIIDRFHDHGKLATSDLLRHLRVTAPTDSLDSAGL